MSGPEPYRGELGSLIDALFEGLLDDEQTDRVLRTVAEDPEAAELYWDFVELRAELRRLHREDSPWTPDQLVSVPVAPGVAPDVASSDPVSPADLLRDPSRLLSSGALPSGMFGSVRSWGLVLGAAVCLGGVAAMIGLFDRSNGPIAASEASPIAQVTSLSGCTWTDVSVDQRGEPNPRLTAGQTVSIQSGSVQLTYDNGVVVTLTGPASYRVVDETLGFLQDGFAQARVPKNAIGFTINTPAGRIIDCGTEFGVVVGKDKRTGVVTADMRVIDGAVDVASPHDKNAQPKRFKAGEGMRMSTLNQGADHAKADDAFDPRAIPGLRLWLNADAGVLRGPDDRVTEMIDLVGDANASAENARQAATESRPRWLSGTINNRPTLVFEGRQYIQLPSQSDLNFRDESLSIFVVGNATGGSQYFLTSRADGKKNDPRGFRFTSSREGGLRYQAAGVTVSQPCDMRQHAVFSVIHDRRAPGANTVTLFRNGRQLGPIVQVDDSDISNAFPLTIGANLEAIRKYPKSKQNYLRGDVGEVLIFDRVLSPEQRGEVESYLIAKYGFTQDGDDAAKEMSGKEESGKDKASNAPSERPKGTIRQERK